MRHLHSLSRPLPAPAYYYTVSLTQKLGELASIATMIDAVKGMLTDQMR